MNDYRYINSALESLIEDTNNYITDLANASALLFSSLSDINWAGFYLYRNGVLVLGPFQGKTACTEIKLGKGVCGTAAEKRETVVVENVHLFKGHIVCDSASNSEIVLPLIINGELFGVVDIDSTIFSRFSQEDRQGLEKFADILCKKFEKPYIRKAKVGDKYDIYAIYKSLIGSEGCVWNEYYPTLDDIETDIGNGATYLCLSGLDELIGCVTVTVDEDQEEISVWTDSIKNPCEITRLGVKREYQHKGYAKKLVIFAESVIRQLGYDGVRLLAYKDNLSAVGLYNAIGYKSVGEVDMYGIGKYICFEKDLKKF